jgi:hypothetical protein
LRRDLRPTHTSDPSGRVRIQVVNAGESYLGIISESGQIIILHDSIATDDA